MTNATKRAVGTAIALSLALALGACANGPNTNSTLYSVHQPVVSRHNYTMDLAASSGGLSPQAQHQLAGWFDAMNVGYGDRIAVDAPGKDPAARADVAAIAGRYGLLLADNAPVTKGVVQPGTIRVVISRSTASVPNCPDWSHKTANNLADRTSSNFGCAVNSNLAAMVADPEQLLHGAKGNGNMTVMTSNKAIESYREAKPTGEGGLPQVNTSKGGN